MAENSLSQTAPSPQGVRDIQFRALGTAPAVLSTDVARDYQQKHSRILREIDRIRSLLPKDFTARNLGRTGYTDASGRRRPAYLLTRDALALLAMAFTGRAALLRTLRYLQAFNAVEASLRALARREAQR